MSEVKMEMKVDVNLRKHSSKEGLL